MKKVNVREFVQIRFNLTDGQMRSDHKGLPFAKNQWGFLEVNGFRNGHCFYGDLSQDDILRIAELLEDGESFITFNEQDGIRARDQSTTPFALNMTPRLVITNTDIRFPTREQ